MGAKRRKRWNGAERMLQAVLHPAAWKTLECRRRRGKVRSKTKGRISATSLDPEVWKGLPQELIERILDRLPFRPFVGCRIVCKRWNDYILSARPPPSPPSKTTLVYFPPFGDFCHQSLTVYNAKSNRWEGHNLSFLSDGGVLGSHSLVSAHGGLLCFCDSAWANFVVCNPVSKQWRLLQPPASILPQFPEMQLVGCPGNYILVGMVVDAEGGRYKLVLAGLIPRMAARRTRPRRLRLPQEEMTNSRTTFVFDSCTGSWSEAPPVPLPPLQLDSGVWTNECPRRSVVSEGKLYWSVSEGNDEGDSPVREVLRFDVEVSKWCSAVVEDHDVRELVAMDGKALVVKLRDGVQLTFDHNHGDGLRTFYSGIDSEICPSEWECRMFEIQEVDSGICLKKRRIPRILRELKRREKVTSKYDNQYGCVGQETSLFVMHQIIDGDFTGGWEMQGWRVLHFNSANDSCVWLPQFNTYVDEQYPSSWWTLQPSLATFV